MAIINLKLKTIPKINPEMSKIINNPSKISTSILIMVYFIKIINPNYRFYDLYHILNQLIKKESVAKKYGISKRKEIAKFLGIKFNKNIYKTRKSYY